MANSGAKLAKQMQQIAADAQVQVQRLANEATEKSFQYNTQEANTARAWQREMSDTSHQREVADLKKAGLNPVLSANQGAQSYTTSSASAQANDPSSTIGNLAGNLIQSKTGAYQADVSAKATRYAASTTAAATKAAAAQAASAQRYAAAMAYQNNRMHEQWQNEYMKNKYAEHTKMLNSTPPKNVAGLIYQFTQRAGFQDIIFDSKAVKGMQSFTKTALNNPSKFFQDNVKITKNNCLSLLNKNGMKAVNTSLKQLGIRPNNTVRKNFLQYLLFSDMSSLNRFLAYMPKKKKSTLR